MARAGWLVAVAIALRATAATAATVSVQLQSADGTPLADAVVAAYALDGARGTATSATTPGNGRGAVVMDQRDRRFVPHILPVEVGTRVRFANSDPVSHHVYSFSPTKRFELYLAKGAGAQSVTFERPGVVALGCNIHDWMLGYVVVLDTPSFGQTGRDGRVGLTGLSAGRYRLEVWHPRITDPVETLRSEVTLQTGATEAWALRLSRPLVPARDQAPSFRDY